MINYYYNIHLLPVCTTDGSTHSRTLKGTWTAEQLNALDLSDATNVDMRDIRLPEGFVPSEGCNPNCLFYVQQGAEHTESLPNLVSVDEAGNATAESIQLTDGHDFYNLIPFRGNVSYTRYLYDGWSTLSLPFPYRIADDERVDTFTQLGSDELLFSKTEGELPANTPCLIYMTAAGEKTFETTDVEIPVTAIPEGIFKSNFIGFTLPYDERLYKLNSTGEAFNHSDGTAQVTAFRAYIELPEEASDASLQRIRHYEQAPTSLEAGVTEIRNEGDCLLIETLQPQVLRIYKPDGTLLEAMQLEAGTNRIRLPKGIYLLNKQKYIF